MNVDNGALEFDTYLNNERLNSSALEAERKIKGLSNTAVNESKKMEDSFSGAGKMLAMVGGTAAIGLIGKQILDTTAKFEKFGIVLRNTLGAEAGNNALDMIAQFAATTPFQLDEVTDSFIRMANQGFVPTREELVKLGDLASSTGKGFNQLTEAILDAQTGEFERLKEFGIKASQNGDKVTFSFREQQTTVDKTNSAIRDYILSLGELNGIQGANALISQSLTGQISNLQDKLAAMFNEIGTSNSGVMYTALDITSSLIDNYELVGKILVGLVATYGAYKAAVILTTAATSGYTIAMQLEYAWLLLVEKAQLLLNATMLKNPYVAAAVAVTALVAGLIIYASTLDDVTQKEKSLQKVKESAGKQYDEQKDKINSLLSVLNNEKVALEQREQALKDIQGIIPGYHASLTTEGKLINNNKDAIDEYLKSLEKQIYLQATMDEKTELTKQKRLKEKEVAAKQVEFDKKNKNISTGVVYGGDAGIAGQVSTMESASSAKSALDKAKKDLKETTDAMSALDDEYAKISNTGDEKQKEKIETKNKEFWEKQKKNAQSELEKMDVSKKGGADWSKQLDIIKKADDQLEKYNTKNQKKQEKELSDYRKNLNDAAIDAYKAENDAKRTQIIDKKELNKLDYEETLRSIDEKERLFKKDAKDAGVTAPDLSSFKKMRDAAKVIYDDKNQDVENEALKFQNKQFNEYIENLIELSEKYKDERKAIEESANKEIAKLRENGYETEAKLAEKERDAKVSAVTEGLITESEAYKLATDDKLQASKETTEILIADIKARIEAEVAAGKLSSETAKKMLADINAAQATVQGNKSQENPFAQLGTAIGNKKAYDIAKSDPKTTTAQLANLESQAGATTASMAAAAGAALMGVQDILGSVVDGMDRLGMLTTEEKKDAENIIGMVGGAANLAMGIATGNPMAIIQGSIDLIVNGIELFDKKSKDIAKKQKALVKEVDNLKLAYDRLERAVSKAFSTNAAQLQQQEITNIQAQIKANNEWIEQENRKKKKKRDQEAIAAKQKENEDLANSIQDKKDAIVESLTGTSIMSAINQFADAYADAFTSGEDAALKSSDAVRSIFKSALIEKLKNDLQPGILELMTMISNAMTDGIITADEKAAIELKKKEQDAIAERNQQAFTDLGLTDAANKKGALSGSIQNVSEETASIISGQMNAMRINQIESMNIMRNQLLALNQIATNTAYNRFLENIDRSLTKISADNLRASGL